jgi:hypothetical protein
MISDQWPVAGKHELQAWERAYAQRKMDVFVRKQYSDQPKKMAEWEKIMEKYEFLDDEIEDEG